MIHVWTGFASKDSGAEAEATFVYDDRADRFEVILSDGTYPANLTLLQRHSVPLPLNSTDDNATLEHFIGVVQLTNGARATRVSYFMRNGKLYVLWSREVYNNNWTRLEFQEVA